MVNAHSESCKTRGGSAVGGHAHKGAAKTTYTLVQVRPNATPSATGAQHASWLTWQRRNTVAPDTVPKSANKLEDLPEGLGY